MAVVRARPNSCATIFFTIGMGRVDAEKGVSKDADLVIATPFERWMDIMTRKADGQQMLMEQKYRVEGDLELMLALFSTGERH